MHTSSIPSKKPESMASCIRSLAVVFLLLVLPVDGWSSDGPISEGNINLTINSSSDVLETYYITAGQVAAFPDSLIPMWLGESDQYDAAQFTIVTSQTVTIKFRSDDDDPYQVNYNFTPGKWYVQGSFVKPTVGTDYAVFTIQKFIRDAPFSNCCWVTQNTYGIDTDNFGEAHFRTDSTNGIQQVTEVPKSEVVMKQLLIPNGDEYFTGRDLFDFDIVCPEPFVVCNGMTRKIWIEGYPDAITLVSSNGLVSSSTTAEVTPYDEFTFESDAFHLRATHVRLPYVPPGPPTIDTILNPAPIRDIDGSQMVTLEGIDDGTPDVSQGLSITASSSSPAVIPTPSVDYSSGESSGTLSYHPVPGTTGSSVIMVTVTDDGGTPTYAPDDSSTSVDFTTRVLAAKPCDGRQCFVYVGHRDHGQVDIIDAGTNQVVETVSVSLLSIDQLAMMPDGGRVYATGFTGGPAHVSVIDTATNTEIGTVPLPDDASALAITPDGGHVYVTVPRLLLGAEDLLVVIDTTTDTVDRTIGLGYDFWPDEVAFSPNKTRAYITTANGNVLVLDTTSDHVVATVPVSPGPHQVAVTPDGEHVYVVNLDSDTVSVIDTATNQVTDTITVGNRPASIAFAPEGDRAYVAAFVRAFNGRLEIIDTATKTMIGTIPFNGLNGPKEIGITPDGTRAYVTFETDRVVSVIALGTNRVVETVPIGTPTIGVALSGLPLSSRKLGDINRDNSVDRNDLNLLLLDRNKSVNDSACGLGCDLDADGLITILDSRKLVLLCTRPRCATE